MTDQCKIYTVLLSSFFITGCSTLDNQPDPWESMNRAVFQFNETIDDKVLEPVARGYKKVVPDPIEMVIGNFFSNLNDVVVTANSLLQLNLSGALASGTRVLINTTFGMLGIVDIASDISAAGDLDINKRNEDFGQTMGRYGVVSGPYLVLPLLGPSTARDALGGGVDAVLFNPISSQIYPHIDAGIRIPAGITGGINARAQFLDTKKTLEEAALDKYEFVRDSYLQRRHNLIHNGNPPRIDDEGE